MGRLFYHYTSISGFEAILKSGSLRMTRSDFMNDPNDCRVFLDVVKKHIESKPLERFVMEGGLNYQAATLEIAKKCPVFEYLEFILQNIPIYILSLTSENDSLPMWNYYGGEGVQLCFDSGELLEEMSRAMCRRPDELVVQTQVEYLEHDALLSSLKLNSFSEFLVREYSAQQGEIVSYSPEIKHDGGENLEFFISSFVKSYLTSLDYFVRRDAQETRQCAENRQMMFQRMFEETKALRNNTGRRALKFKADIELYMPVLATRYKPKTFANEAETRMSFFSYRIGGIAEEQYAVNQGRFGQYFRPYVECRFPGRVLAKLLKGIVLSPMTRKLPFQEETYRRMICNFVNRQGGEIQAQDVRLSGHDIRW